MEDVVYYYDEIDHYDEQEEIMCLRIPKTYVRDALNPFEIKDFKKKFRFCKDSVLYITNLIRDKLQKPTRRGLPVAPEIAVLMTLRFYATASFQSVCGDLFQFSQPTASNIITKVSKLLAQLHEQFIKFPTGNRLLQNRKLFKNLGKHGTWPGLTGIDGAIDCTHVKIVSTPGCRFHEVYRNRKSDFSINVQAIVGPNTEFLDIVARWAGSMHDSRIFQMSRVHMRYTQRCICMHNLSLILNDRMLYPQSDSVNDDSDNSNSEIPSSISGFALRNSIIENYFQ